MEEILPNLHRLEDSCNVYVLTDGDRALLIDCGSGAVLDALPALGVKQVDWVLFTHHHRDQCYGADRLVSHGARLAVPEHERFLFEQAGTKKLAYLTDAKWVPDEVIEVVDQRTVSTVAAQSLFLMNHPFVLQLLPPMASAASRGLNPASSDAALAARLSQLYLSLFAREPTPQEQRLGIALLRRAVATAAPAQRQQAWHHAWQQYCQVLLCTNELIYLN